MWRFCASRSLFSWVLQTKLAVSERVGELVVGMRGDQWKKLIIMAPPPPMPSLRPPP